MAKLRKSSEGFFFKCPACNCAHQVWTEGSGPKWEWNGSLDKPTFRPSLRVMVKANTGRCHFVITDGMMHFEMDNDNVEWRGRVVEIPEWGITGDYK